MSDPMLYMLADLHVDEASTHYQHNARLREMFGWLAKIVAPGDVVQFYGDSVNSPTKGNYVKLTEVISPLIDAKCGLSFIVGNHDNSKTGLFWWSGGDEMFRRFKRHVNALPRKFQVGNCEMINLDTTLHTWMPTDLAQGEVGDRQLRQLKKELDESRARGLISIVGGHHDPTSWVEPEKMLDAAKLFNVLRRGKAGKYICGHSHQYNLMTQRFDNIPGQAGGHSSDLTLNHTEIIVLSDPKTKYFYNGWCFGPMQIDLATGEFTADSELKDTIEDLSIDEEMKKPGWVYKSAD